MILNTYAILIAFVGLLRLLLGLLAVAGGAAGWWWCGRSSSVDGRSALENRGYLLFLATILLVGFNLVSWPLLYLLLQSYVPEWPGVMCIFGVTQVGKGSVGSSRFLPDLLHVLQLTKPALVFAGGSWFVLYLLNRRTQTGSLLRHLFVLVVPLGLLAVADAAAELAYVAIPKKEEFPPGGCCLTDSDGDLTRFVPTELVGDSGRPWLSAAYVAANLGLILALFVAGRRTRSAPRPGALALLVLLGLIVFGISGVFLVEVAAPRLLHLPHHHCAYDLIPKTPEAVVAVVLFVAGLFFLGWAGVARWFGRGPETEYAAANAVRDLLRMSYWAYVASLTMLVLELVLA